VTRGGSAHPAAIWCEHRRDARARAGKARLAETRRPHAWRADFPELARQFVAGRAHHGWEPQEALDAPGFWSQLAFPDAWMVNVERSHGAPAAANAPARV
jgi:hypothetical protein